MIKTGSPMKEILDFYSDDIDRSPILSKLELEEKEFFLVSMHRQENVDSQERLQSLLASLIYVRSTWNKPILVSTHPRTKSKLSALLSDAQIPGILFHEPFGFLDYVKLQKSALCVLSDSGTISEEAAILGFKAITIRDSMERPEALEAGQIILAGIQPISIENALRSTLESRAQQAFDPDGYEVNNFSERVVKFIFSTYDKYHFWFGIRNNDQA
jgi:UDP-N-acetylglucosamine 2-epimerase (non-hydrolysing)